jgi:hypothetical protein
MKPSSLKPYCVLQHVIGLQEFNWFRKLMLVYHTMAAAYCAVHQRSAWRQIVKSMHACMHTILQESREAPGLGTNPARSTHLFPIRPNSDGNDTTHASVAILFSAATSIAARILSLERHPSTLPDMPAPPALTSRCIQDVTKAITRTHRPRVMHMPSLPLGLVQMHRTRCLPAKPPPQRWYRVLPSPHVLRLMRTGANATLLCSVTCATSVSSAVLRISFTDVVK